MNFPFLIFYVFYYVLYGIVIIITLDKTHATYNDIEFENYPYISRAVKAVLPVIGIYIISMILSFLGFILLIVPGIIVFLTLYLSIPAKLAENISIIDSLKRSRELTKGNRWSIFGTMLVPLIPIIIISFSVMSKLMVDIPENGTIPQSIDPIYTVIYTLFSSIVGVYFTVVMGAIYQQIVAEKKAQDDGSF